MKVIKFIISGGGAFLTNIVLLYVFTEFFGWWYILSATLSYTLSIGIGFSLNKFWTFLDHSTEGVYTQVSLYILINLFNLLLNILMLYVLVDYFGLWYISAQIITSVILAIESFFLYKRIFNRLSI